MSNAYELTLPPNYKLDLSLAILGYLSWIDNVYKKDDERVIVIETGHDLFGVRRRLNGVFDVSPGALKKVTEQPLPI